MSLIFEQPNLFTDFLCEDIIDLFNEMNTDKSNIINIPKNDNTWTKIEKILYKNILIKLNEYKISLLNKNDAGDLVNELSKSLKLQHFTIQKYNDNIPEKFSRINSRKNVVTFILFLNKPEEGGEILFKEKIENNYETHIMFPEIGKLIIFPDNIDYIFKINKYKGDYYVISNQISCC